MVGSGTDRYALPYIWVTTCCYCFYNIQLKLVSNKSLTYLLQETLDFSVIEPFQIVWAKK